MSKADRGDPGRECSKTLLIGRKGSVSCTLNATDTNLCVCTTSGQGMSYVATKSILDKGEGYEKLVQIIEKART
jgi:hypothetical protein